MGTSAELITNLRAAAKDTPYAVRETPNGFDLTIDVADAQWLTISRPTASRRCSPTRSVSKRRTSR